MYVFKSSNLVITHVPIAVTPLKTHISNFKKKHKLSQI